MNRPGSDPRRTGLHEAGGIVLEDHQVELLRALVGAHRAVMPRCTFIVTFDLAVPSVGILHPGLTDGFRAALTDLRALDDQNLLRLTQRGPDHWIFDVTPAGVRYCAELAGTRPLQTGWLGRSRSVLAATARRLPRAGKKLVSLVLLVPVAGWIGLSMQDQGAINAVRPELVLRDWKTSYAPTLGEFWVRTVENSGEGAAVAINASAHVAGRDDLDCSVLFAEPIQILPKGGKRPIEWYSRFRWSCGHRDKFVALRLVTTYKDINDNLYTRTFDLAATPVASGAERLADGLYLSSTCVAVRSPRQFWAVMFLRSWKTCPT